MHYKKLSAICLLLVSLFKVLSAQHGQFCSYEEVMLKNNPNRLEVEQNFFQNEQFIQDFIRDLRANKKAIPSSYTIPIVLHVFHNGADGMIDEAQAHSSIDVLNADMKGLNDDFNMINPRFDSIKATIDVEFCFASIDPEGNPTTGIIYYDNEPAMYNNINLKQFGWDNYRYLNIYLPKYATGGPSIYTANATYPNTATSNNGLDGIVHSSYRWGLGSLSELTTEDDRISIVTHEVGHWLNLFHTFQNGCSPPGDYVDDTPPSTGGDPEPVGCDNFNLTCGVESNGSNYMDYNLDCKKMFTEGQVERMLAALHLPVRTPIWSDENLISTGCSSVNNCGDLTVSFSGLPRSVPISSSFALTGMPAGGTFSGPGVTFNMLNTSLLTPGLYTINYNYSDADGCSGTSSQTVLVYAIVFNFVTYQLGTIEPKALPYVDVQFEVYQSNEYDIEIFNVAGKQLHQSHYQFNTGSHNKRFHLEPSANKGMYFMRVSSDDHTVIRKWVW